VKQTPGHGHGWHLVRGACVGAALFGTIAHALLLLGLPVWFWLLPLSGAVACAVAIVAARREQQIDWVAKAPRWLLRTTVLVVAVCTLSLAFGAVATQPRVWDGVVAWGIKAAAVNSAMTLEQPFFADPSVLHHSPDYPLLQPLMLGGLAPFFGASGARLLFPLLYLAMVSGIGFATMRHTRNQNIGCWIALAVASTPFFLNTHGGGADSGYGEMFFATALAVVAVGLLLEDALLLASAALVLAWIKPEGAIVLPLVACTCFAFAGPRIWLSAAIAGMVSLALWLPLQQQLGHREVGAMLPLGVVLVVVVAIAARAFLDRRGVGIRGRALVLLVFAVMAGIALVVARPMLATSPSPLIGQYLGRIDSVLSKLNEVPTIVFGLLEIGLFKVQRFGLTFLLLLVAAITVCRGRRERGLAGAQGLLVLFALGMLAVFAAFLLSPEQNVRHHLRSSGARLLSHWLGVAWLVIAVVWGHMQPQRVSGSRSVRPISAPPERVGYTD
tara:strand:+ start:107 stop:1606 length:1500 start_codon:yes stop_codon:yes gene_type:complete